MDSLTAEQQAVIAQKREDAIEEAKNAYDKLDTNGDGHIDRDELKAHATAAGAKLTGGSSDADIDTFFQTFDANNDGVVSREQWLAFFGTLFDAFIKQGLSNAK